MATSFRDLYRKAERTPGYQAERMAVTFLSELNSHMKARGMTNSDLARAAGVSPAYITKLFRGPSNVSLETIAKLALAVECQPHLHLANRSAQVRWFDLMQNRSPLPERARTTDAFRSTIQALERTKPRSSDPASNDREIRVATLEFA